MPKLPAFLFYTGDWLADAGLRTVSYAARGLWIDMLCFMSESDPRGYLKLNGQPMSPQALAKATGGQADEVRPLLQELQAAGVFSTERGIIYSRRMVEDEQRRQQAVENGRKGGNPTLIRQTVNRGDNPPDKPPDKPIPVPVPSPVPGEEKNPPSPFADVEFADAMPPELLRSGEFMPAWRDWVEYRKERKPKITPLAAKEQIAKCAVWGPRRAAAAIRNSIAGSYQGIYEDKSGNGRNGRARVTPKEEWSNGKYFPG